VATERKRPIKWPILLAVLFGLVIGAVIGLALYGPTTTVKPIFQPVGSDQTCLWNGTAKAWIDENENGTWDESEPPLEGVRFSYDGLKDDGTQSGVESVSKPNGEALLAVWSYDCSSPIFGINAKPPNGYRATSPTRVLGGMYEDNGVAWRKGGTYLFGFAHDSAVSTWPTTFLLSASTALVVIALVVGWLLRSRRKAQADV
jgi:hypothetical protein